MLVMQSIAINLVSNHDRVLDPSKYQVEFYLPVYWSSLIFIHDKSNKFKFCISFKIYILPK